MSFSKGQIAPISAGIVTIIKLVDPSTASGKSGATIKIKHPFDVWILNDIIALVAGNWLKFLVWLTEVQPLKFHIILWINSNIFLEKEHRLLPKQTMVPTIGTELRGSWPVWISICRPHRTRKKVLLLYKAYKWSVKPRHVRGLSYSILLPVHKLSIISMANHFKWSTTTK